MIKIILKIKYFILLFLLSFFRDFKLILAQEYTLSLDEHSFHHTIDFVKGQLIKTKSYQFQCPSNQRRLFSKRNFIEFQADQQSLAFKIVQDTYYFTVECLFVIKEKTDLVYQVVEICIKGVDVKQESIDTSSYSTETFSYKSKPDNYNENMKAIPFIIGYAFGDEEKKKSIFIESWEAQHDGFQFNFSTSAPQTIKRIDINYLYYDINTFNNYFKLEYFQGTLCKKIDPPTTNPFTSETFTFSSVYYESGSWEEKVHLGIIGFDFYLLDSLFIFHFRPYSDKSNFYTLFSTEPNSNSQLYGGTSLILTFQIKKCNNDPNSQTQINYKDRCLENCPEGEYEVYDKKRNIIICQKCNQTCKTCQNLFQCLTCPENKYFQNKQCYQTQPINLQPIDFEYIYALNSIIDTQIFQHYISYNDQPEQIKTINYKIKDCPSNQRRLIALLNSFKLPSSIKLNFSVRIVQNQNDFTVEFFNQYYKLQVVEICIQGIDIKQESIDTSSYSTQNFSYKSKPDNYSQNMKAIPFITGFDLGDEEQKISVFLESWEAQNDGFQFNFSTLIPQTIKRIYINYLYYDINTFNNYFRFEWVQGIKYKTINPPSQESVMRLEENIIFSMQTCKKYDDRSVGKGFMIGYNGLDLDIIKFPFDLFIKAFYFYPNQVNIQYGSDNEFKLNGFTSSIFVFQMKRCNYDVNSKTYINYKDKCIEKCPDGEYEEYESERKIIICQKCNQKCKTCQNKFQCLSCLEGQYYYQKQCLDTRPKNKYCI